MVDLIAGLSHFDASAVVALLLVALLAALKWIGRGLIKRIESLEAALDEFDRAQQGHTTRLAVVEARLNSSEQTDVRHQ